MRRTILFFAFLIAVAAASGYWFKSSSGFRNKLIPTVEAAGRLTQGSLQVLDSQGQVRALCPLKHTDVMAEVTGFLSRVTVTQQFENPFEDKIEAVYTFPLPQGAAVDDMTMIAGERTIHARIKRREEARAIYAAARAAGHVASLLDQERPNIFTQSVANILPGQQVKVVISYVETLKYEDGGYEFVFPMVVGPRYIPGAPAGKQAGGWAPDTGRVPDASRITPPVAIEGTRAGHDVSLEVAVDAGVPLGEITSCTHEIDVQRTSASGALIRLKELSVIPNKDFVVKYQTAGEEIGDAILSHRSAKGGFFTMILQPPERIAVRDVTPKELVFVLDTSGSMSGFPIEKAKETMALALAGLYPSDTFNLITFSGDTHVLFPEPVSATAENLKQAKAFLASRSGNGGTEMMKAIRAALDPSDASDHVRIVCFMTDGYVGNDMEIISEVQKHANARVFAFGIGSSVNRFLLGKMAEFGRGEAEYVLPNDPASDAAQRFHDRIRNPLLTDVQVDWGGLPVADVYPSRIPDLFGAKPLVLAGRFTGAARGVIRISGKRVGFDITREIPIAFPETEPKHDVLATLWARRRIDDLSSQDYAGMQSGAMRDDLRETITQLGLEYRLMTPFTSFVAVEEKIVTEGGEPRRIEVPVEMPEGVDREKVFGEKAKVVSGNGNAGGVAGGALGGVAASAQHERVLLAPENTVVAPPAPPLPPAVALSSARMSSADLAPSATYRRVSPVSGAKKPSEEPSAAKLDAAVLRALQDWQRDSSRTPRADFIREGKAEIKIWLTSKSASVMSQLRSLGALVIRNRKESDFVVARVPLDRIEALARLDVIKHIAPAGRKGS